MKTFEQYNNDTGKRLDEFVEPLTFSLVVFLGTMFLRSNLFGHFIDKIEVVVDKLEKNHFLKQCVAKMHTLPRNPSIDDVKEALGPDFDRFKKEFTDQVAKP